MARTLTQSGPERANRLIFIGAIALAALAAVLVFVALSNFGGDGGSETAGLGGTVDVVVASRDLKAGTTISAEMLEIASLPSRSAISGALTEQKAAVGLTVRIPIQKNEQISTAKLGQGDEDKVFAGVIPAGMRAIAIPVSETTSVGGLIVAGDRVDITAVIDQSSGDKNSRASTLLQNVLVLSVAQTSQKATARLDADGNPITEGPISDRPDNTSAKPTAKSITVAVNPQDVPLIALAEEQGKIYLSLRPVDDNAAVAGLDAPRTLPNP